MENNKNRQLNKENLELFNQTTLLLKTKYKPYYLKKLEGINNSNIITPRLPIPVNFRKSIYNQEFKWADKVLKVYQQNLKFDGFKNDLFGFTRLFYESEADHAVNSCIKKSLIGGVSFLWVFRDSSEYKTKMLVRGSNSTVIVRDNNNDIVFAITTVETKENTVGKEYFVYTKDRFYKVDDLGRIIEEGSNKHVNILVFSVDAEYGRAEIGKSIFSESFFTAQKNASISQTLMQQGSLLTLGNKNILLANGIEPTSSDLDNNEVSTVSEVYQEGDTLPTIYNPVSNATLSLATLEDINVNSIKDIILENAKIAASEVFLTPEYLGYKYEEIESLGFKERIKSLQNAYAEVINTLGKIIMSNYLGIEIDSTWGDLGVKFESITELEKIGQIGDALYKLNDLGVDISSITDSIIGKNIKEEKILIELPSNDRKIKVGGVVEKTLSETLKQEEDFVKRLNELTIKTQILPDSKHVGNSDNTSDSDA